MKLQFSKAGSLLIALAMLMNQSINLSVSAKEWTISERQDQLMKDINEAQKRKDLTEKEAKRLRSDLADVARKEAKIKGKNNGTIPAVETAKLEAGLNDVSVKIKSLALEKRVDQAKKEGAKEQEAKDAEKKAEKDAEKAAKKSAEKKSAK